MPPSQSVYAKIADELEWLKLNPAFEERPATLLEFLGPDYLDVEDGIRARIKDELAHIMGDEVQGNRITQYPLAMITGGIGIGKTTIASIVLPYLAHWVLCLKNPQKFFGLLPGSRIAFMQMSTNEKLVLEVVFGDIKARIQHSKWFSEKYPFDPKFTNQIRFPKDIWIIPGDSKETTFEGYNILGGILDEADSHQVTKTKDYAEQGYTTIYSRITSRFGRVERKTILPGGVEDVKYISFGFLLVIGQMKKAVGFAARKYKEFNENPNAYAVRMAIWESLGWEKYLDANGERDSFFYDAHRKQIVPKLVAKAAGFSNSHLIEVPEAYRQDFENNPEKALRDLAGIPPMVGDPFISLVHKIDEAEDRWKDKHGDISPVSVDGIIAQWLVAQDPLKRVVHIDIAYSANGDALGLAMGHVPELIEVDGELKPYIVIDFLMRVTAPPGGEIFLGNIRHVVYDLAGPRKFRIVKATLDGFQSTDTMQQFKRRRIETELVSVDKQLLPYHDLREALYEDRIEFPPYYVHVARGDVETVPILKKELSELVDNGTKIDHPDTGSKDVADAVAGVTFTLMGNRAYHRKVVRLDAFREQQTQQRAVAGGFMHHPAYVGDRGLHAPVPPSSSPQGFRR